MSRHGASQSIVFSRTNTEILIVKTKFEEKACTESTLRETPRETHDRIENNDEVTRQRHLDAFAAYFDDDSDSADGENESAQDDREAAENKSRIAETESKRGFEDNPQPDDNDSSE